MLITLTEAEAKRMHDLIRSASTRREQKVFVVEGPHLLEESLRHGASIEIAVFTSAAEASQESLVASCQSAKLKLRSVSDKLARKISETEQSQGVFAVIRSSPNSNAIGNVILALDGVQDPGNVGTLIRTALWFGVRAIIHGSGTADPYGAKVLRSTQGAIFGVSIEHAPQLDKKIEELRKAGYTCLITSLEHNSRSLYDIEVPSKVVIVLGSEAHGVSEGIGKLADLAIRIPNIGPVESLNVAVSGGIVLSELVRRSK